MYAYRIFVTLDAVLKSGTLAERSDKRPGIPGTQPHLGVYVADAPKLKVNVGDMKNE